MVTLRNKVILVTPSASSKSREYAAAGHMSGGREPDDSVTKFIPDNFLFYL